MQNEKMIKNVDRTMRGDNTARCKVSPTIMAC